MTRVTCRLTTTNRDQLRNPTLGSRVWATDTFFNLTAASVNGVCAVRRRPLTAVSVVTRAFDGHIVGPSVMWAAGRHASDCCADQSDVIIHARKRGSAVAEGPRDSSLHGIFFAP